MSLITVQIFYRSKKYTQKLNPFLDRKNDLVAFVNNPDAVEVKDDEGNIMEADSINEELEALNVKIEELQKRIASYDNNPTKKNTPTRLKRGHESPWQKMYKEGDSGHDMGSRRKLRWMRGLGGIQVDVSSKHYRQHRLGTVSAV